MPGVKGRSGRETELTPAIAKAICDDVSGGMPEWRAAVGLGFDKSIISKWKARAERDEKAGRKSAYVKFFRDLIKADVNFERTRIALARKSCLDPKQGHLNLKMLAMKYEHWRPSLRVSNDPKNPIPSGIGGAVIILPDNGRGDGPDREIPKKPKNAGRRR